MTTYAGESLEKKIARALVYDRIAEALPTRGSARVVGLSGPNASDVDLCEAFGITTADRVSLADVDPACAEAANRRGARGFLGPIDTLEVGGLVDVAVFDWCGDPTTDQARRAYANFDYRVGAVISVTSLKGRERPDSYQRGVQRDLAARSDLDPTLNEARHVALYIALADATGCSTLGHVQRGGWNVRDGQRVLMSLGTVGYQGHASPMRIDLFQVVRGFRAREVWRSTVLLQDQLNTGVPKGASVLWALRVADRLEARGIDPAKALAIRASTLAAWRAHRTMGTYDCRESGGA